MADHLDQLARAVYFMEENLDKSFHLGITAREAGMSAFHFSRVFLAVTGQNASEYFRKRKLTRAADLLISTTLPIIEVAFSCGFETQEAFTRAFRRWYGVPPARFRKRALPYMLKDTPPLSREILAALACGEVSLEPRFEERGESVYVGLCCRNTAGKIGIPGLWVRFLDQMDRITGTVDRSTYGIYRYDLRTGTASMGEDFPFQYLAGMERTSDSEAAPSGMETWRIPAARYAVFCHRGFLRDLGRTYRYIYKTWFTRQGADFAPAPFFERRRPDYPGDLADAETEIWIPVRN